MISILQNGSLFSSHKLAILKNIEEIKKVGDIKLLSEFCDTCPNDVTLIMVSDGVAIDKRFDKMVLPVQKKIFWEMFDNQKKGWIQKFYSDLGMRIEPRAIEIILEMVENNTSDLKQACEKLSFYFNIGDVITEDDIDNFVFHSKEENVFTLFEKILRRDLTGTLETFSKIKLSGDTDLVFLLSGLIRQIRRIRLVKQALQRGDSLQEAFTAYDVRGKKNQKLTGEGLRLYTLDQLEWAQKEGDKLDKDLRSYRKEMQEIAFQLYLTRFITSEKRE